MVADGLWGPHAAPRSPSTVRARVMAHGGGEADAGAGSRPVASRLWSRCVVGVPVSLASHGGEERLGSPNRGGGGRWRLGDTEGFPTVGCGWPRAPASLWSERGSPSLESPGMVGCTRGHAVPGRGGGSRLR